MAASATSSTGRLPRRSRPPGVGDLGVRALEWLVSIATLVVLALLGVSAADVRAVLPWLPFVVVTNLLSVRVWGNIVLTVSLPVLLAAGIVLGPRLSGLLALVGSVDQREWRREVTFTQAVFNRCQIAASTMIAAGVYHALTGGTYHLPSALAAFTPAAIADFVVNLGVVLIFARMAFRLPWATLLRNLLGGRPIEYVLTYLCLGYLAVALVVLDRSSGSWGLVVGLAPLILARQLFAHSKRLNEASLAIEAKNRALIAVSSQIAAERRDERVCVAGELHDEVLQPLYQVHLMGEVLRRDLATGRLLELEDDLPRLLAATQAAQEALRRVIRDLRDSSLGPGGLRTALSVLVRNLEASTPARIDAHVEEVAGSPLVQLLAYQIAREALQNAIKHSRARHILLSVHQDGDAIRIAVEDDGIGFSPLEARGGDHFGLQLMRERAEAGGGMLSIDSTPGGGTRVAARLPTRADEV